MGFLVFSRKSLMRFLVFFKQNLEYIFLVFSRENVRWNFLYFWRKMVDGIFRVFKGRFWKYFLYFWRKMLDGISCIWWDFLCFRRKILMRCLVFLKWWGFLYFWKMHERFLVLLLENAWKISCIFKGKNLNLF